MTGKLLSAKEEIFMFIERDGKKYELTAKELSDANTEFVTNWMKSTLENDFDVPEVPLCGTGL